MIKIGIDYHGTLAQDPKFFSAFSKIIVETGNECHIMTGSMITQKLKSELEALGMVWTHLFSIADYYKDKPEAGLKMDDLGRPWVSDELWNSAKGKYAKEQNLDLVLDDTQEYGNYFENSFAFCNIVNKSGKKRIQKAKRPTEFI